jgi:membrane fusion protein, multidrug efflux system
MSGLKPVAQVWEMIIVRIVHSIGLSLRGNARETEGGAINCSDHVEGRAAPFALLASGVWLAVLLSGCRSSQVQSAGPPPPVPVSVATAAQESFPIDIRAVGTAEASAVIQVRSQVSGVLVRVGFSEGADVQQGDLLFEIDPRPYQDALQLAEAALQRDTAVLKQAQANQARDAAQAKSLQADADRFAQLVKEGIVSRSQNDQVSAAAEANRASISADEAAVESARASMDSDRIAIARAKLDLSYCQIQAPVGGRTGNLLVHQGNLIAANAAQPLVTINRLEPIWVSFGVPEEHLNAIRQSAAGRQLAVGVALQNDSAQRASGMLSVIDNAVDPATGTIRLKATFDNRNRLLWPGQFVDVSLTLGIERNVVVVPAEAVQPGQRGQVVYVVNPNQTVELRQVTVGLTRGNKVSIAKGVAAGETVVIDGQLRLVPGARVRAVPLGMVDSEKL